MKPFLTTGIDPACAKSWTPREYVVTHPDPVILPPVIGDLPMLGGSLVVGGTLTTGNGIWMGATPMTLQTRVEYSDVAPPNANWQPVPDNAGESIVTTTGDLGRYYRLAQRATNAGGTSDWAFSPIRGPIIAETVDPPVYPRTATPETAALMFAGHSGVQTGNGAPTFDTPAGHGGILYMEWGGTTGIDFYPFGTMKQIWDQNGLARTGSYDFMLTSEGTTDLDNGFAPLAQSAETMQYLFNLAETAHAKGAEAALMIMWPRVRTKVCTPHRLEFFQGLREWYQAETGRDMWMVPAAQFVRACFDDLGMTADQVFIDPVIHLSHAVARGVSYLEYSFLTQQRCPFVQAGDEALDDLAWETLLTWECAGMGGPLTITVPPYTNPLPDPVPLPTPGVAPTLTTAPVLSGPSVEGQGNQLTLGNGVWSGSPTSFTKRWQWRQDGNPEWAVLDGYTSDTLGIPPGSFGTLYLRGQVRATNEHGQSGWATSNVVGPIEQYVGPPQMQGDLTLNLSFPDGRLEPGVEVYSSTGGWSWQGTDPVTEYRLQVSDDGVADWTTHSTNTTGLFIVPLEVAGKHLRNQVQMTDSNGASGWITGVNVLGPVLGAGEIVYPPTTSRVHLNGHSLIDAIESGDGDARPTWRTFIPAGQPAGIWRRNTIPGSPMRIRWGNRNGYNYDGEFPPVDPGPLDFSNPNSPLITARDMGEFDVFMITESGPFALPLNPDRFNALFNESADYLGRFHTLAMTAGISPDNFLFWTIWPGLNYVKDAEDDPDLPDYLALCERYNATAEQWCGRLGIRIIPGHRIMAEVWQRIMDGRLPSHVDDGREYYRFSYLFDTDPDDLIHPTFLGSIFVAVGCHRHMFGVMPTDAQIQALLDAEPDHPYTLAHVKDTIDATTDYVQGPGIDLQIGTFVPPTPFIDYSQPLAAQGATVLGAGVIMGTPVGPNNGFTKALAEPVPTTDRLDMYAILEVSMSQAEALTAVALATNEQWNAWDAKFLGLTLNDENGGNAFGFLDGDQFTNMVISRPWDDSFRWLVELNAGPLGRRIRGLNDGNQWLPSWAPRGTRALPTTQFGCNATYAGGNLVTTAGNFTVYKGLVYLDSYPDELTRLRLIAHMNSGIVP